MPKLKENKVEIFDLRYWPDGKKIAEKISVGGEIIEGPFFVEFVYPEETRINADGQGGL